MNEQTYKVRTRVNFSVSVKGIVTPDITYELIDGSTEDTIKGATELLDKAMLEAKKRSKEE